MKFTFFMQKKMKSKTNKREYQLEATKHDKRVVKQAKRLNTETVYIQMRTKLLALYTDF